MVSIHGVPVNVLLIISVVYLIFRFKRGADFRLSKWRLWKDPVENKRHNTPHSDRYGISGHRMCPSTSIYTKVSVVPCHPFYKKTSTFSFKDLRKTLSQNVMSNRINSWHYKCRKFFLEKQHSLGYCVIQYSELTKNDKSRMEWLMFPNDIYMQYILEVYLKYSKDNMFMQLSSQA